MTKHESCIYYLFKETFSDQDKIRKMSGATLIGVKEMLMRIIKEIDKRLEELE